MERVGHFDGFFVLVEHLFAEEAGEGVADDSGDTGAEDTETKDELGRHCGHWDFFDFFFRPTRLCLLLS
jgi:hypothetical protein